MGWSSFSLKVSLNKINIIGHVKLNQLSSNKIVLS